MDDFMPSEIARLVLGYLKETGCTNAWKAFLNECSDLREYSVCYKRGLKPSTNINGKSLIDILEDYAHISSSKKGSDKETSCNDADKCCDHTCTSESPQSPTITRNFCGNTNCKENPKQGPQINITTNNTRNLEQSSSHSAKQNDPRSMPSSEVERCERRTSSDAAVVHSSFCSTSCRALCMENDDEPEPMETDETVSIQRQSLLHSHELNSSSCFGRHHDPHQCRLSCQASSNERNANDGQQHLVTCNSKSRKINSILKNNVQCNSETNHFRCVYQNSVNKNPTLPLNSNRPTPCTNTSRATCQNDVQRSTSSSSTQPFSVARQNTSELPSNSEKHCTDGNFSSLCQKSFANFRSHFESLSPSASPHVQHAENAKDLPNVGATSVCTPSSSPKSSSLQTPTKYVYIDEDSRSPRRKSQLPRRRFQSASSSPPPLPRAAGHQSTELDVQTHTEDSVDFGVFLDELINYPALHEKIAENINKVVQSDRKQPNTENSDASQVLNPDQPESPHEIHIPDEVIKDIAIRTSNDPVVEEILSMLYGKYDSSRDGSECATSKVSGQVSFGPFTNTNHYEDVSPPSSIAASSPAKATIASEQSDSRNLPKEQQVANQEAKLLQRKESETNVVNTSLSKENSNSLNKEKDKSSASSKRKALTSPRVTRQSTRQAQNAKNHPPSNQTAKQNPNKVSAKPVAKTVRQVASKTASSSCSAGSVDGKQRTATTGAPSCVSLDGFLSFKAAASDFAPSASNIVFSTVPDAGVQNSFVLGPTFTPMKITVPDFQVLTLSPSQIFGMSSTWSVDTQGQLRKPFILPKSVPNELQPPATTVSNAVICTTGQNSPSKPNQVTFANQGACHTYSKSRKKRRKSDVTLKQNPQIFEDNRITTKLLFPNQPIRNVDLVPCSDTQQEAPQVVDVANGSNIQCDAADVVVVDPPTVEVITSNEDTSNKFPRSQSPRTSRLQLLVNSAFALALEQNKANHVRNLDFGREEATTSTSKEQPREGSSIDTDASKNVPENRTENDALNSVDLHDNSLSTQNEPSTRETNNAQSASAEQSHSPTQNWRIVTRKPRNSIECDVSRTLVSLAKGGVAFLSPSSTDSQECDASVPSTSEIKGSAKRKRPQKKGTDLVKLDVDKFLDKVHSSR